MKLMVSSHVLQQILKEHPEVELELVKTAEAQIAEQFRRKVNVDAFVSRAIDKINERMSSSYYMPVEIKNLFTMTAQDAVKGAAQQLAKAEADRMFKAAVQDAIKIIERVLESHVKSLVQKEVENTVARAIRGLGAK